MTFFISFSAQAIESLVEVPVTAFASMLGRMKELVISCTLSEAGAGRHDVLVVDLLLAEQVADPLLRGLDVLRKLPDADRARRGDVVAAGGTRQAQGVIDTVGGGQLLVASNDVGADRIVDPAGLALL